MIRMIIAWEAARDQPGRRAWLSHRKSKPEISVLLRQTSVAQKKAKGKMNKGRVKDGKKTKVVRKGAQGNPLGGYGLYSTCPFPRRRPIKLRYAETQLLTEAAVGAGVQQVWNLNGIYDTNATGAGHQPLYYDQLFSATGPYQRYTVDFARIEVTISNNATVPILAAVYLQVGALDYPSRDLLLEKPGVKVVQLSSVNAGGSTKTIGWSVDLAKLFGVPHRKLIADDVYSGFWNSNPSQICFAVAMIYSMPGVATVAAAFTDTRIVFGGYAYGLSAIGMS